MKTNKRIIGDNGEELAASYLKNHRYKILERNFLVSGGELDIIAIETKKSRIIECNGIKIPKDFLNEDVLCFIEVKTRTSDSYGSPADAVDKLKQKNIVHAASCYMFDKKVNKMQFRYDIIEILDGKINHIKNAF